MARIIGLMALLFATITSSAMDTKYVPAKWRQELSSTVLVGYKPGEYLVSSSVTTGRDGLDAVVKYGLEVKVESIGKEFANTHEYEHRGKKYKESLKVTLKAATEPRELNADFEHVVIEDGNVILRFAGLTILHHWQGK